MAVDAQLLGPPLVTRDGVVYAPPRGKKVWALFAYLALAEQPPTRQQLARCCSPTPRTRPTPCDGTCRSCGGCSGAPTRSAAARRSGSGCRSTRRSTCPCCWRGPRRTPSSCPGSAGSCWRASTSRPARGSTPGCSGNDAASSRSAARSCARGRCGRSRRATRAGAVALATRLLGADPLSEDAHVLLVRAFAATGDEAAVERQLAASADLFRVSSGSTSRPSSTARPGWSRGRGARRRPRAPPRRTWSPARRRSRPARSTSGSRSSATPRLGAASGETAVEAPRCSAGVGAGARGARPGRGRVRRAAPRDRAGRRDRGPTHLGGGAPRARLRRAAARRLRAQEVWLQRARSFADDDPLELSRIRSVTGGGVQRHRQARAGDARVRGVDRARDGVGNVRALAWAADDSGPRPAVARRGRGGAGDAGDARERTRAEHWTAFLSLPESLLGEVWLRTRQAGAAAAMFEHAFTLGCSVDDACWEAYAVRGSGCCRRRAATSRRDRVDRRRAHAVPAPARHPHWIRGYVMEARCAPGIGGRGIRWSARG